MFVEYVRGYLSVCLSVWPVLGICQAEQLPLPLLLGQASKTQFIVARRRPLGESAHTPSLPHSLPCLCSPLFCNFLQLLVLLFALWLFVFGQDCGLCCLVRLSWSSSQFVRLFHCPCALKIENHNRINFGSSQKFVLPPPPSPKTPPKVGNGMRGIICTGLV